MVQLSRNAQVLRYLIQVAPGSGHTKLAKFAYLADLEARRYTGRPISRFRYKLFPYGPFPGKPFFAARDELTRHGYAVEATVPSGSYSCQELSPTASVPEYDFSVAEAQLLAWVAESYMALTARELCDDVVYQTEPMKKRKLNVGEELPMDSMNKKPGDELGFSLERMLAGEASAKAGRTRPVAEALRELRDRAV